MAQLNPAGFYELTNEKRLYQLGGLEMLVYANSIWLESQETDCALQQMAFWLAQKTKRPFASVALKKEDSWHIDRVHHVHSWVAIDAYPHLYAVRYEHPEEENRDRQWRTEVGIRQETEDSPVLCTVLLSTRENSTLVTEAPSVSVPRIVNLIGDNCILGAGMMKSSCLLTEDIAEDIANNHLYEKQRNYTIILISPRREGDDLIDADALAKKALGLAHVYRIPNGFDTYRLRDVLGREHTPYNGAISLSYPPSRYGGVYTKKVFAEEFDYPDNGRDTPLDEVLKQLTHHNNVSLSQRHISPDTVKEAASQRRLAQMREQAKRSGNQSEWTHYLEQEVDRLDEARKAADLKYDELEKNAERERDDIEKQLNRSQHDLESAKLYS